MCVLYIIFLSTKNQPCALLVPPEILKLRDERGSVVTTDCKIFFFVTTNGLTVSAIKAVNFSEFDREPSGRVNLIGRVK